MGGRGPAAVTFLFPQPANMPATMSTTAAMRARFIPFRNFAKAASSFCFIIYESPGQVQKSLALLPACEEWRPVWGKWKMRSRAERFVNHLYPRKNTWVYDYFRTELRER